MLLQSPESSLESFILWGGISLVFLAVYIETGLLLGLVIPGGETLLFSSGVLCSAKTIEIDLIPLILIITMAAILGDNTGYLIGRKSDKKISRLKDNVFYKQRYLEKSRKFYQKFGYPAIILGRFFPVIRTFNPIIAGVSNIPWRYFFLSSMLGSLLYCSSIILAGYYLGKQFPWIQKNLEIIFFSVAILIIIIFIFNLAKIKHSQKARS